MRRLGRSLYALAFGVACFAGAARPSRADDAVPCEVIAHGSPDFRVRGKTFATYVINHHGDGRVALWLNAPAGAQELYTREEPKHFFVPPYVGPRGWLGVRLDGRVDWTEIAAICRDAYRVVAPKTLAAQLDAR